LQGRQSGLNDFSGLTMQNALLAFKKFHQNDLQQWYRLLLRSSSFLNLGLHERIAITLLELATDFGIKDSRGALLAAAFSHQDLADLVGASRPRVTEHLARLERERLVIRQGRQLIVRIDKIGDAIATRPWSSFGAHTVRPTRLRSLVTSKKTANARMH
jgi:hypothetical protein